MHAIGARGGKRQAPTDAAAVDIGGGQPSLWDEAERAQVWARDTRQDPEAPLIFLPRGGRDVLLGEGRLRDFICPLPDCDQPRLAVVGGSSRRHHFRHLSSPASNHQPKRLMHVQGKAMLAGWVQRRWPKLSVAVEVPILNGKRVADVLVTSPTGARLAFEVQYAALGEEQWRARHRDYEAAGIVDIWLWGHLPPHWKAPPGNQRHPGERAITPAMLAYTHETGQPLLWINPEEQLLACGALHDDTAGRTPNCSWAFLTNSAALAYPSPLDDWRLTPSGPANTTSDDLLMARAQRARDVAEAAETRRRQDAERARREAERQAKQEWRERNASRLEEAKARYQREDKGRWEKEAPLLLSRVGGVLPEDIARPLKSDRLIYMTPAHWHAIVYATHLHDRAGSAFSYRSVCRTVFSALEAAGKHQERRHVYAGITGFLFHLRRCGWVTFDAQPGSPYIDGPILADVPAPRPGQTPGPDLQAQAS